MRQHRSRRSASTQLGAWSVAFEVSFFGTLPLYLWDRMSNSPLAPGLHAFTYSCLNERSSLMRVMTPPEHEEGVVAKTIEQQTAKLPSDTFLWMAGGSIAASIAFKVMGREHDSLFVGQWAPTFLILGLYNKLVKLMGSD